MGVTKVKKTATKNVKPKSRLLTKKEKAYKRVAHIKKVIDAKKKAKSIQKKSKISLKRKQNQQAQDQNIQLVAPQQNYQANNNQQQQINILNLLGLGSGEMQGETSWQQKLQDKLKQVNSKSLDNPEVRRVYTQIGRIFATYRSGKVPKAFKIIPNLQKWRQVIEMMHPDKWTPQAMYQAVSIFASNFDPVRAQEFYREHLVPAIRNDLKKNKKLNYHYYQSLKKALYKTNAWFKGILFEFCDKKVQLKQIKVIESLLTKMSIPVISSSVALIKMTQMEPSSAIVHYLKALVSKNYSFPKKVLVVLTGYLMKFRQLEEQMPVIWQQLFLTIVRQYGGSLDQMAKANLVQLAKKKSHKLITPQILKQLN